MPKIVQYNLPPGGTVVELADNTADALVITDTAGERFMKITTTDNAEQLELGVGAGDGGAMENAGLIIREIDGSLPELQICNEMGFISDTDTMMRLAGSNTIAFKLAGSDTFKMAPSVTTLLAGALQIDGLTASSDVQTDGSKQLTSVSDMRLKNEVGLIDDGLGKIKQLIPRYFAWKEDDNQTSQLGFFSQEVHEVCPEAGPKSPAMIPVSGEDEDDAEPVQATDADGNPDFTWGLNTRALVALLVKAVQELSAKVDTLEAGD